MAALSDRAPPELEPGITVDSLATVEECDAALDSLTMAIASIEGQLSRTKRSSPNQPAGWRENAEAALRIKKFMMPRVQERRGLLKREAKQAQHAQAVATARSASMEKNAILCRIAREIAPDVMGRVQAVAESRHPHLFGKETRV